MSEVPADRRQPIFNIPGIVLATIVVMAAVHGGRLLLSDASDATLLQRFAFVPGRLSATFDPAAVADRLQALAGADRTGGGADAAAFLLGSGSAQPWTLLTYALLHGSWTHFGLNAVWLLAFGTPLARRLGALRFSVFCALGALAGAAAHYATDPLSLQPLIGASAAVSACMGAALRFMFRARSVPEDVLRPAALAPRLPLSALFRDRRSGTFLIAWMVSNFATGAAAVPLGLSDMPIAWQAHVGGFLFGLLAFAPFDSVPAHSRSGEPGPDPAGQGPGAPVP